MYPALHTHPVLNPHTRPLRHREVTCLVQGHTASREAVTLARKWDLFGHQGQTELRRRCPRSQEDFEKPQQGPLLSAGPSILSLAASVPFPLSPGHRDGLHSPASLSPPGPSCIVLSLGMRALPGRGSLFSSLGYPELLELRLAHSRHATNKCEVNE